MSKPHLFFIEADPVAVQNMASPLRDAGYTVTVLPDVPSARALLDDAVFDVALINLDIDPVDASHLCHEIRHHPQHRTVPLFGITACEDLSTKVAALELGIDELLVPPIYLQDVLMRLRLNAQRTRRATIQRSTSRSKIIGRLQETQPYDLLRVIHASGRSAVITAKSEQGEFFAWFIDGELVDAQDGHRYGAEAVYGFATRRKGTYEIEFKDIRRQRMIEQSLEALIAESFDRLDRLNQIKETLPPLDQVLRRAGAIDPAVVAQLDDTQRNVFRKIDGTRTVDELLELHTPEGLRNAEAVSRLYFFGLVHLEGEDIEDAATSSAPSLERWGAPDEPLDMAESRPPAPRTRATTPRADLPPAPEYAPEASAGANEGVVLQGAAIGRDGSGPEPARSDETDAGDPSPARTDAREPEAARQGETSAGEVAEDDATVGEVVEEAVPEEAMPEEAVLEARVPEVAVHDDDDAASVVAPSRDSNDDGAADATASPVDTSSSAVDVTTTVHEAPSRATSAALARELSARGFDVDTVMPSSLPRQVDDGRTHVNVDDPRLAPATEPGGDRGGEPGGDAAAAPPDARGFDVDMVQGAGAAPPRRRIDEVRAEIRRSQALDDADDPASSNPLQPLSDRTNAILEDEGRGTLVDAHTDPHDPNLGEKAADASPPAAALGTRAPVLTGPSAEDSVFGVPIAALDELGPAGDDVPVSGTLAGRVDETPEPDMRPREANVRINRPQPPGPAPQGDLAAQSEQDMRRLAMRAELEDDAILTISRGHRPAMESIRAPVDTTDEPAPSSSSTTQPARARASSSTALPPPTGGAPRPRGGTTIGLPPPSGSAPALRVDDAGATDDGVPTGSTAVRSGKRTPEIDDEIEAVEDARSAASSSMHWGEVQPRSRVVPTLLVVGAAGLVVGLIAWSLRAPPSPRLDGSETLAAAEAPEDETAGAASGADDNNAHAVTPSTAGAAAPGGDEESDALAATAGDDGTTIADSTTTANATTGEGDTTTNDDTASTAGETGETALGGEGDTAADTEAAAGTETTGGTGDDGALPEDAAPSDDASTTGDTERELPATEEVAAAASADAADDSPQEPLAPAVAMRRATAAYESGKYAQADQLVDAALDADPGSTKAIMLRAKIKLELKDFEAAMRAARKVTLLDSTMVEAHLIVGVSAEALGSKEGAIDAYRRFLKAAPEHPYVLSIQRELKRLGAVEEPE